MSNSWKSDRRSAHNLIKSWGGAGILRRGAVDRDCICALVDFKPYEKGNIIEGARRILISALAPDGTVLAEAPDGEQDVLVYGGDIMNIIPPTLGPRPSGNPVFYDIQVIYSSKA